MCKLYIIEQEEKEEKYSPPSLPLHPWVSGSNPKLIIHYSHIIKDYPASEFL